MQCPPRPWRNPSNPAADRGSQCNRQRGRIPTPNHSNTNSSDPCIPSAGRWSWCQSEPLRRTACIVRFHTPPRPRPALNRSSRPARRPRSCSIAESSPWSRRRTPRGSSLNTVEVAAGSRMESPPCRAHSRRSPWGRCRLASRTGTSRDTSRLSAPSQASDSSSTCKCPCTPAVRSSWWSCCTAGDSQGRSRFESTP